MRRMVTSAALLALVGIAPAFAERLYVPVVGAATADGRSLPTEVWVNNRAQTKTMVAAGFLREARGESRTFDVAPGGRLLDRMAGAGEVGLVAIDGDAAAVSAWVADGANHVSEVPVIGARDSYESGATPGLELARGYDRLLVGAANLSEAKTSCEAKLYSDDNRELGRFRFDVAAKSLVRQDPSGILGGERAAYAQVACDRTFYPVGVTTRANASSAGLIVAKGVGPNGACEVNLTLVVQSDGSFVATAPGLHKASKGSPKWVVCIKNPTGASLNIDKAIFSWDVLTDAWYPRNSSGIHNLGYFFGERYRSGVIGNVNALGPSKYLVKFMQNYNMGAGSNTVNKAAFHMNTGTAYHPNFTFDAGNTTATLRLVNEGGPDLINLSKETHPGNGHSLVVRPYGKGDLTNLSLVAEFGNYEAAHPSEPEVPTYNWTYSNFRVRLVPK
jgi:hypothetical protein